MPIYNSSDKFTCLAHCSWVDGSGIVPGFYNFKNDSTGVGLADTPGINLGQGTVDITTAPGKMSVISNGVSVPDPYWVGARLDCIPSGNYDARWRMDVAACGGGVGLQTYRSGSYLQFFVYQDGANKKIYCGIGGSSASVSIGEASTAFFRLVRSGTTMTGYFRLSESDNWTSLISVTQDTPGEPRFMVGNNGSAAFSQLNVFSGFTLQAEFQVHDSGSDHLSATTATYKWRMADWLTAPEGLSVEASYFASTSSGSSPVYGDYLSWANFLLEEDQPAYFWLKLRLTGSGVFQSLTGSDFLEDVTPPEAPSSAKYIIPNGETFAALNWVEPVEDYAYCKLRRTKNNAYEYLRNVDGLPVWSSLESSPWKFIEGESALGVSPFSSFVDEISSGVTAYHICSVDPAGNVSAWTSCAPLSGEGEFEGVLVLPSEEDVRYPIGFGADGTEFTGKLHPESSGGDAPVLPKLQITVAEEVVTFTISQSDAEALNHIYLCSPANMQWIHKAAEFGDGVVTLTPGKGTWFALLMSHKGGVAVSCPYTFCVLPEPEAGKKTAAQIVAKRLVDLGLATSARQRKEWPVFISHMPDAPSVSDNAICVSDTAGTRDGRISSTGETVFHPGVQVYVRSKRFGDGQEKAQAILETLEKGGVGAVVLDSYIFRILNTSPSSQVLFLGGEEEGKRRVSFTVNFILTIKEDSE